MVLHLDVDVDSKVEEARPRELLAFHKRATSSGRRGIVRLAVGTSDAICLAWYHDLSFNIRICFVLE